MKLKGRRKSKNVEDMRSPAANRIQFISEENREKWNPVGPPVEAKRTIPKKVFGFDEKDMEDSVARLHKAAKKNPRLKKVKD